MTSGVRVVSINPGSDGDSSHVPQSSLHTPVNPPTLYLEKIALLWMQHRGEAVRGITYRLDRLPAGYSMWQKPRMKEPKHLDKWLFGHPSRKFFDSPNRFFPHFLNLMENGSSIGCPCTVCNGNRRGSASRKSISIARNVSSEPTKQGPTTSSYFPQRGRKPKLDLGRVKKIDDEGTPDVYRNLIDELKVRGTIDEPIQERLSMDWRAERALAPETLERSLTKPAWVPRTGELVLFTRHMSPGEEIQYDESNSRYGIFDSNKNHFTRSIKWEAGVISQVAQKATLEVDDLVHHPQVESQEYQVNYSGFRVEPVPDLQSKDKSLSVQHKYVYLHQTRPFIFWKEILENVPDHEYDPTIYNALNLMSTISLVEKYHFKGNWPSASVSCKGLYISSELLLVGDIIRLMPRSGSGNVIDLLHIRSIQLRFSRLDQASDSDYDEGHPYSSAIYLFGTGYTASEKGTPLKGQGRWTIRHDPSQQLKVSVNRILGRLYEDEATKLFFPSLPSPLDAGLDGLIAARKVSRLRDTRIPDGKEWYWAESRTDALDLKTFNGQEVSKFDEDRDPREWRKMIKIIEGVAGEQEKAAIKQKVAAQRSLRDFGAFQYQPTNAIQESDTEGLTSGHQSRKRSRSERSEDEERSLGMQLDEDDWSLDDNNDDAMEGVVRNNVATMNGTKQSFTTVN